MPQMHPAKTRSGRDTFPEDPSRVIVILQAGLLVSAWMVLASHYNSIPSDFGAFTEALRVLFVPALMVGGYVAFMTYAAGSRARKTPGGRKSWVSVVIAFLTLLVCLLIAS